MIRIESRQSLRTPVDEKSKSKRIIQVRSMPFEGGGYTEKYKVEIVRPECSGCELCTTICEDIFEMAADGFSTLKNGHRVGDNDELELDDAECVKQAAADCPVSCIHVYEGTNKLL